MKQKEREFMGRGITCPSCGTVDLDVCRYDAMMVLRSDLALFTLHCPQCGTVVSGLHSIPLQLRDEVRFAAIEVGAGMGRE
ncbi:UDP-N-acetylmuramoylalanyl-D-glutamate--2,6-diaminopimelate ligase [Eggerthella sp. YY7918]|uniref:UDP-N-acetylmuramoylalanyl-D-glutamate--2, 6-diaminopimelate ligase n=1 Tax=Eggerthella sp. (strain YY7918) TaxID=502558 RepID=UPI000312F47B|nr:UDP-N-acetylmuramoylalanyl-D-glutamate--2,6-diaminopimelate ligase [Eggerthella sp. YY7918]